MIVDDEAPARRYLRRLLEASPGVCVTAEAATIAQTRTLILEDEPDVVFLDIGLTCGTGFDLLAHLDRTPAVVFVTAHADYATRAFDVQAVDYLLKPVSPARLAKTLSRLQPRTTSLPMRTKTGKSFLRVHDLTLAQAQGDYVRLCSAQNENELTHITLKHLATQLPFPPFCILSRSLIINLDHVSHIARRPGQPTQVLFSNGIAPLDLGRAATQRLRHAMTSPPRLKTE